MNKEEYLETTLNRLQSLSDDPTFRNNLAQIRARAVQEELISRSAEIAFTFNPKNIWKYCDYLFSESNRLLMERYGDKQSIVELIRIPAQAFEFLSKFSDDDNREILLLQSALCYQVAGYQANAQCIAKQAEKEFPFIEEGDATIDNYENILVSLFRKSLVIFLRKKISHLMQSNQNAISVIHNMQELITRGIAEDELTLDELFYLTAHASYHRAISEFLAYCLNGSINSFNKSEEYARTSYENFSKIRDATFGVITSEFRTALDTFFDRSTWECIRKSSPNLVENRIWRLYLRNVAYEKSLVEFWPSQIKAIEHGLLTSEEGFVIQMPTSAGKTLIAELAILSALSTNENSKCVYIAPYRALVNEVKDSLSGSLGTLGFRVSNLLGGFEYDAFQNFLAQESDILVATPEKIDLFLRSHPEYFENLEVVIVDEGHILDEGIPSINKVRSREDFTDELDRNASLGRGPLLELLITRLKTRFSSAKFLFLSAVMPEVNTSDFTQWLSANNPDPIYIPNDKRPSRQIISKFEWKSKENGQIVYINLPKLANEASPFVPYFLKRQQYYTGERTPTDRMKRTSWPDINSKVQTTAMLAVKFANSGPVLVYCAQQADVRKVADNIIKSLTYLEASALLNTNILNHLKSPETESYYLSLEWLGREHVLTNALQWGVGIHYGPIPEQLRQSIEDDFRGGKIRILISTNTLGQGVNLPIKTALIYSLERVWGEGEENREQIKKRDFWNICGRAGRAGKETEGQIVFVTISDRDKELIDDYSDYQDLESVNSALFELLVLLINNRIDKNDLLGYIDSHILALLAEEIVDTEDQEEIERYLRTSLVGIQAERNGYDVAPLADSIVNASRWVVENVPDASRRMAYSRTGLRVESCQRLEDEVRNFVESIDDDYIHEEKQRLVCNFDLLRAAFNGCSELPEIALDRRYQYHGPEEEMTLIDGWIRGASIRDIKLEFWSEPTDESFSEYVSDRLTYKLPWGLNSFLQILAFNLDLSTEDLPISWQYLSSMMKFGVDSVIACWACSLGINSRSIAHQLANSYEPNGEESFVDFLNWAVNLSSDFIEARIEALNIEKQRLVNTLSGLISDRETLNFIQGKQNQLFSFVRGIQFQDRDKFASEATIGDRVDLDPEPDNPFDPFAIRVVHNGNQIGYIQRDKSKFVANELGLGRKVTAIVNEIYEPTEQKPYHRIKVALMFE